MEAALRGPLTQWAEERQAAPNNEAASRLKAAAQHVLAAVSALEPGWQVRYCRCRTQASQI